jgi:putative transposase
MQIQTTHRYKLKPTKQQSIIFEQWLGSCRFVHNVAMEVKNTAYKTAKINIGKYEMMKQLTEAKKEVEFLNDVHSQVLQHALDRMYGSYGNFFGKRAKFPKYAKKDRYLSFTFKQGVKIHENTFRIYLPKIGKVRFFKDRIDNINIATATIKKEVDGWYVSVSGKVEREPMPTTNKSIGIDVGIRYFATTSDGQHFESPKYLLKAEAKLRHLQKEVSRKVKGSNNRKKAVFSLAKAHQKVTETRKDFLNKLSTQLIRENQSISVEKLNIKNMVKNHKLAKSISDAGWGMFKVMLKYKSEYNNRTFVEVAARNTSKQCSVCGLINDDLKLGVSEWDCKGCGTHHDRDDNAATNILNKGFGLNLSTCGENVIPSFISRSFSVKQEPHFL